MKKGNMCAKLPDKELPMVISHRPALLAKLNRLINLNTKRAELT